LNLQEVVLSIARIDLEIGNNINTNYSFPSTSSKSYNSPYLSPYFSLSQSVTSNTSPASVVSSVPSHEIFIVVGTSYSIPDETEPTKGRLIVFRFNY
jgi:hypothetical protein